MSQLIVSPTCECFFRKRAQELEVSFVKTSEHFLHQRTIELYPYFTTGFCMCQEGKIGLTIVPEFL